jgi:rod shape-determining protein MreC
VARDRGQSEDYSGPLKRLLLGVLILCLLGLFLLWRIDSPRVERFRAQVVDRVVPSFDWAMAPVTGAVNILRDFQSYQRMYQQNQDLRRELQQMKAWKEAALQLEQENARLLDLNNVQLDPRLTYVTGVVMADSGSPFRQSVLINVGARDGIMDGWAAMDGLGLVGRISGVGRNTARVLLLTDTSSRIPVSTQPSGQRALVIGDNSANPLLDFIETPDQVRPGDRVMTTGDGGVFPAGLLVGQVIEDRGGRMRVRIAADYERLEFLRVLRSYGNDRIDDPGALIAPAAGPRAADQANAARVGDE